MSENTTAPTTDQPPGFDTGTLPRPPWWRRKLILIPAGALALVLAVVLPLTAFAGPGTFTARGSETVTIDAPDVTDGSQVIVTDSAGHVLGTGTLATDNSAAAQKTIHEFDSLQAIMPASLGGNDSPGMSIYTFTIRDLPAGQARYGVAIGKDRGTIWFSEHQMRAGANLSLGDS
jgi:hypothetical protein